MALLRQNGAPHVFIDDGTITRAVRNEFPNGVDRVLELVGTMTLLDSLECAAPQGIVCMTGMVVNEWELERFSPMGAIPPAVHFTTYAGGADDFVRTPLQKFVRAIKQGKTTVTLGPVFRLHDTANAHRCMRTLAPRARSTSSPNTMPQPHGYG